MNEIALSRSLRLYGAALLLTNIGTGLLWFERSLSRPFIGQDLMTCWPFFPTCQSWPIHENSLSAISLILMIAGTLALPLFLKPERCKWGVLALGSLTALRAFTSFSSFGFTGNYHYINLLMIFAYLFLPRKKELLPILIVGVYASSAILKFNSEWLSGAAIFNVPSFVPHWMLVAGCYYVVLLESLIGWMLLSSSRRLRMVALTQFALFHLASAAAVGIYFPFVMFCLLSLFLLREYDEDPPPPLLNALSKFSLSRSTTILVLLFLLAQLVPRFLVLDTALSGLPRSISVTMLDATPVCETSAMFRSERGYHHLTQLIKLRAVRGACDPLEFLSQVDRICRTQTSEFSTSATHISLRSKRATDQAFTQILNIDDACHTPYPLRFAELFQPQARITGTSGGRAVLSGPIVFSSATASSSSATPTFQFRGGESRTGDLFKSKAESLALMWSGPETNVDLHQASKSSPAVDTTGIYVGSDTGWFKKYDFKGNVVWSFYAQTLLRGIHSTPTLTEDSVYFGAYNGWLYSLNKITGEPRWAISLGKAIGASPLVVGGDLYITVETENDGFIAKLRTQDGSIRWVSEFLGEQAHSSVTLDKEAGLAIVGTNAKSIVAVELATGRRKWTHLTPAENKGTGALISGIYVFGSVDAGLYGLKAATGEELWSVKTEGRIVGNVATASDKQNSFAAISSTAGLFAFEPLTGKKLWSHKYSGARFNSVFGRQTPLISESNGHYYVLAQCEDYKLCEFSGSSGLILNRWPIGGVYSNTPAFFNKRLIFSYNKEGMEIRQLGLAK